MLNERGLEVFLQVYQTGSIRLAARRLYVSPQSVSKTILDLEAELGEKLFIRGRLLVPTRQAEQLKGHAQLILKEYQAIRRGQGPGGAPFRLKVYCTYGVVEYLGAAFVEGFWRERPDILLYLVEVPDKQAFELLRQREPGVAILSDPSDQHLFDSRPLFRSGYSFVLPEGHPLCALEEISLRDLDGARIVGKGDEFQLYINQMSRVSRENLGVEVLLETTSYHLAMQMAKSGLAIALTPSYLARQYAPPGTAVRPAKPGEQEKQFFLVRPRGLPLREEAQAFARFLAHWVPGAD